MLITSLSVPGTHLQCNPRVGKDSDDWKKHGEFWAKIQHAYIIWRGAGMSIQGVRTCGDYMFSGHTVALTMLNFFITECEYFKIWRVEVKRNLICLNSLNFFCNIQGLDTK